MKRDHAGVLARLVACSFAAALLVARVAGAAVEPAGVPASGQAAASPQPQVYHLTAYRAAPGHYADVLKMLSAPPAAGEPPSFVVVFRHAQGQEWDFLAVEHVGRTATIGAPDSATEPPPSRMSEIIAWHGDTFAWGPPLDEFRRALSLDGTQAEGRSRPSVYVVSDYAAVAGHRGQLRDVLAQIAKGTPDRIVTLVHMEGAPWQFLTITRYDSWRQFGEDQEGAQQPPQGSQAPLGVELRRHMSVHHDTIATVAEVRQGGPAR